MAEVLNTDLRQGIDTTTLAHPNNTDDTILQALDTLYGTIDTLEAMRKDLQARPPESIIDPKEFASFRGYCLTLARAGRQAHRDKYEVKHTSSRVGSIIAALYEGQQPMYAKTRPKAPGGTPEYTLGLIVATQAVVVGDFPMENKVALRVRTSNGRRGESLTQIYIDDIAAQLEAYADTGYDTPTTAVGQQAVKGFVKQAYANPRAERSASGVDSCDMFWAMCNSGISLRQLGFSEEEVNVYKSRIIANLHNVCSKGATYMHDVPMLPPLCSSIQEVMSIIDGAFAQKCPHKLPHQLGRERNILLDKYLPARAVQLT